MGESVLPLFVTAILAFLLGSIPFGLLLTRVAGYGDIRRMGSGNIGATNVLRTGNKALAAATLLLDAGKGALAVLIAARYGEAMASTALLAVVLGHVFPPWLAFKGGKGVATTGGALLAYLWPVGVIIILVWLAVALLTRYSSLAALAAAAIAPIAAWLVAAPGRQPALVVLLLAALVVERHRANIGRLLRGEESKIRLRRQAEASTQD